MKTQYEKGSQEYLIDQTDFNIGELVYEKVHLYKAYNYYHGVRDANQFKHLEENYGIGTPTSVPFTPFISKHVNAIVNEFLATNPHPRVSCKDEKTLSGIMREKQLAVAQKNFEYAKKFLNNTIYQALKGGNQQQQQNQQAVDAIIAKELEEIKETVDRDFISNYEIAGQVIIEMLLKSRDVDFNNKLKDIVRDLVIGGEGYFRDIKSKTNNVNIEVFDPINTFVERNPRSPYVKHGYRSVVRKWMSTQEVIMTYGNKLSAEDIDHIVNYHGDFSGDNLMYIQACSARSGGGCRDYQGLLQNYREFFTTTSDNTLWNLLPVYEVEWLDFDKKGDEIVAKRYETVRIGSDIYLLDEEPYEFKNEEPRLTLNGIFFSDRTGLPYSLMLKTASLQDDYDITIFRLNNTLALAGTKCAIIDVAHLPEFLGDTLEEKIIKHKAFRKTGDFYIDTSQEGDQMPNTIFNGLNEAIDPNVIQAYQIRLQMLEEQASSISGVFRERIGGIQQRDAVSNVEMSIQTSFIITKQYHQAFNTIIQEMMLDGINLAKKVYKKGVTGQMLLGGLQQVFTILPEHYEATVFDVHIGDQNEITKETELIKQLAMQLAGSAQIDPEIIVSMTTSKSLTEMRDAVLKSIAKKREENNVLMQYKQQSEEMAKQLEQLQKQLEKTTQKLNQLNEKKMAMEQQDNTAQQKIDMFKIQENSRIKEKELDLINQRNKLEYAQLFDNNPNNDRISNNKK